MEKTSARLTDEEFKNLTRTGILPAIDLLVFNENGEVLVGKRKNKPAQGYWFVPGGRTYRMATRQDEVERIIEAELGVKLAFHEAKEVFSADHIYEDSMFDNQTGTHYWTTCYALPPLKQGIDPKIFFDQHEEAAWMPVEELIERADVHQNTKNWLVAACKPK